MLRFYSSKMLTCFIIVKSTVRKLAVVVGRRRGEARERKRREHKISYSKFDTVIVAAGCQFVRRLERERERDPAKLLQVKSAWINKRFLAHSQVSSFTRIEMNIFVIEKKKFFLNFLTPIKIT